MRSPFRWPRGKLKARALAEEAIANHERFGAKLMAYSQWAPEHARKCADAADAAFAVGSRAGSLQGIPTSIKDLFAVAGFPTYAGSLKRLQPRNKRSRKIFSSVSQRFACERYSFRLGYRSRNINTVAYF